MTGKILYIPAPIDLANTLELLLDGFQTDAHTCGCDYCAEQEEKEFDRVRALIEELRRGNYR